MRKFNITKASGLVVPFSTRKLRKSLRKGGASSAAIDRILSEVSASLYPGITTSEIFEKAFGLLQESNSEWAGKYKLKRAIFELGPSGFPFERFVAALLQAQGYVAETGIFFQGKCVMHEMDIRAVKGGQVILGECKFHSMAGVQSDVKIPLYVKSRFDDIEDGMPEDDRGFRRWLVTNTRFTSDALRYGMCAGLTLVSWDYPNKGGIRDMIDRLRLFPITCLTTLTAEEKSILLKKDIVLVSELPKYRDFLSKLVKNPGRMENIMDECRKLCR